MPFQSTPERNTTNTANHSRGDLTYIVCDLSKFFGFHFFSVCVCVCFICVYSFFCLAETDSNARHKSNAKQHNNNRGRCAQNVTGRRQTGRMFEGKSMFVGQKSTRFSIERNERCQMERNRRRTRFNTWVCCCPFAHIRVIFFCMSNFRRIFYFFFCFCFFNSIQGNQTISNVARTLSTRINQTPTQSEFRVQMGPLR